MDLLSELNRLISVYGFRPRKKLSQFFLIDKKVIEKMIELAELKQTDRALEVGAGTGFISREIIKHCPLTAVELDETLALVLEKELSNKNLKVIQGNFLSQDFKGKKFTKVISAVPYHLSSQIISRIISMNPEKAVLLLQEEFADKLTSKPFYLNYSATTVLVKHFFKVKKSFKISPEAFFPKPNCFSSIVVMDSKNIKMPLTKQEQFTKFIKTLFRFKNKTLSNALKTSFQFLKEDLNLKEKEFLTKIQALKFKDERVCGLEGEDFLNALNELTKD
jgi:ribosomal RNA small subunit methyltransferase A